MLPKSMQDLVAVTSQIVRYKDVDDAVCTYWYEPELPVFGESCYN